MRRVNCRQVQFSHISSKETGRKIRSADQRLSVIGTTSIYGRHVFSYTLKSVGGLSFQAINILPMAQNCLLCPLVCLFGCVILCCEDGAKRHGELWLQGTVEARGAVSYEHL